MRVYFKIKMDRSCDPNKHYISPGGYEVRLGNGTCYQFDFNESFGGRSEEDDSILEFELRDEDIASFPNISELKEHLSEIVAMTEFFIYTGEHNDSEINPVKLISFELWNTFGSLNVPPQDTEYITCHTANGEKTDYTIVYCFTQKLLDTVSFNI